MATNRGVAYVKPGVVEVRSIPFPKLEDPRGKRIDHGVILRVVSTNICGSDQHMVRERTRLRVPCRQTSRAKQGLFGPTCARNSRQERLTAVTRHRQTSIRYR